MNAYEYVSTQHALALEEAAESEAAEAAEPTPIGTDKAAAETSLWMQYSARLLCATPSRDALGPAGWWRRALVFGCSF